IAVEMKSKEEMNVAAGRDAEARLDLVPPRMVDVPSEPEAARAIRVAGGVGGRAMSGAAAAAPPPVASAKAGRAERTNSSASFQTDEKFRGFGNQAPGDALTIQS